MARKRRTMTRRSKRRMGAGRGLSVRVYLEPKAMWRRMWEHFGM